MYIHCFYIVRRIGGETWSEGGLLGCSAGMMDGKSKICELERYVPDESRNIIYFHDGDKKKLQTFRPSHWGN